MQTIYISSDVDQTFSECLKNLVINGHVERFVHHPFQVIADSVEPVVECVQ